ncbi:hypothetical protein FKM82_028299 [Ascaphus truei]
MSDRFLARGYTSKDISAAFTKADALDRDTLIRNTKKQDKVIRDRDLSLSHKKPQSPLFISTFNAQSQQICNIISKHWHTLLLDRDIQSAIQKGPRFTYRKANTLAFHLSPSMFDTRSKFPKVKSIPTGFFKCGKCSMCQYARPTKYITYNTKIRKYFIKNFLNCNICYVVYVLYCGCGHQYVGRTTRPLKVRIAEHVRLIKKKNLDHPVARHFALCPNGGINNFTFSAIEHIPIHARGGNRENVLNKQEMYWIYTLNTLHPHGINLDWELKHFLQG